jgi:hypothetical protein
MHNQGRAVGSKSSLVYVDRQLTRNTTIHRRTAEGHYPKEDLPRNLAAIKVPVPPSAEQERIVAEIDKQFTRLDAAVAALNRAKANLKRYRATVLKAACEGRLVPTEAELARKEGRNYEAPRAGPRPHPQRAARQVGG